RKDVEVIWRDKRSGLGTHCCWHLSAVASARVNRLDQAWITDRNMNQVACRVEKGRIWFSGERPLTKLFSGSRVDCHQRSAVAGDVQNGVFVIDVEPMRAFRRKRPVLYLIQFRQLSNEHHGGFANCEEYPCSLAIRHAPARSSRKGH